MTQRNRRFRQSLRIEPLETRNAPSHIGGLAHIAAAAHSVHAATHVKRFIDTVAQDRTSSVDKSAGVERSADRAVETSTDPSGVDTSPTDRSVTDPSGQN